MGEDTLPKHEKITYPIERKKRKGGPKLIEFVEELGGGGIGLTEENWRSREN